MSHPSQSSESLLCCRCTRKGLWLTPPSSTLSSGRYILQYSPLFIWTLFLSPQSYTQMYVNYISPLLYLHSSISRLFYTSPRHYLSSSISLLTYISLLRFPNPFQMQTIAWGPKSVYGQLMAVMGEVSVIISSLQVHIVSSLHVWNVSRLFVFTYSIV